MFGANIMVILVGSRETAKALASFGGGIFRLFFR